MRKAAIWLVALSLAATGGYATQPAIAARQVSPAAAFKALAQDYIATLTRLDPVQATQLGDHDYDGRLPDVSAAGRAEERAQWQRLLAALGKIDRSRLSPDDQVDDLLLKNQLEYSRWQLDQEQDWAWNPQVYNDIASNALYSLAERDYAPWPQRLRAATERMVRLPAFLAESRRQLDPARVPLIHAQTVAQQNAGIMEIADDILLPHAGELSGADRARFDAAYAGLKAAVAEQQKWLDGTLVPNAKGDFRLGAKLYDQKMRFALMSTITRPQLKAKAQAAFKDTRADMERLARSFPDCDHGDQQQAIECGLDKTYAHRATRDTLEDVARQTLAQATDFVRAKGFVSMPAAPVRVVEMPKFSQGNSVAYDDPPGALDKDQPNLYTVSPIPADWTDEQANSFLTEYNLYMIHDLSIHEAMPGHYLQLDHANRNDDPLRALLESGPFVEGWAVYGEGMMADQGYLGGDATEDGRLFRLTMLKMRLRSVTNTLLDIGIQTEGMTRDQAMDLMMHGAFQQEREAAGKWVRAQLSSAQLLSYYTGFEEHMALREEAKQRWGKAFTLRRYNDAVLAHGSPPVRFVRELMFGLPVN